MENKSYIISLPLLSAVVQYLADKPFREVTEMLSALKQLQEYEVSPKLTGKPEGELNGQQ